MQHVSIIELHLREKNQDWVARITGTNDFWLRVSSLSCNLATCLNTPFLVSDSPV